MSFFFNQKTLQEFGIEQEFLILIKFYKIHKSDIYCHESRKKSLIVKFYIDKMITKLTQRNVNNSIE